MKLFAFNSKNGTMCSYIINILFYVILLSCSFQVTHSQQHACPKCTFLTDNEDILKDHVAEVHDVSDFEELLMTDDEVRTPKTNSQGKVNKMR